MSGPLTARSPCSSSTSMVSSHAVLRSWRRQLRGGTSWCSRRPGWARGSERPDIAGYRAFHYSRPDALQAGQARGGLACYVRQELHDYVRHISCDPTNSFAVLRVSKEAGFEQDLYLIVCYIAPRDSTSISMAHPRHLGAAGGKRRHRT